MPKTRTFILAFILAIAGFCQFATASRLSPSVPAKSFKLHLNDMEKAAKKNDISLAFLMAMYSSGEHNGNWPEGPWASSPVGASGPFQFMECTWEGWNQSSCGAPNVGTANGQFSTSPTEISRLGGLGKDCSNDGRAEVNNFADASCAAAHYLSSIGAGGVYGVSGRELDSLRNAASRYNSGKPWSVGRGYAETAAYVPAVINHYLYLRKRGFGIKSAGGHKAKFDDAVRRNLQGTADAYTENLIIPVSLTRQSEGSKRSGNVASSKPGIQLWQKLVVVLIVLMAIVYFVTQTEVGATLLFDMRYEVTEAVQAVTLALPRRRKSKKERRWQ